MKLLILTSLFLMLVVVPYTNTLGLSASNTDTTTAALPHSDNNLTGEATVEDTSDDNLGEAKIEDNDTTGEAMVGNNDATEEAKIEDSNIAGEATVEDNPTASPSDSICHKNFGECMKKTDRESCSANSSWLTRICGATDDVCCMPSQVQVDAWASVDAQCEEGFGNCFQDTESCKGEWNIKKCGGPSFRSCCLPGPEEMKSWDDESCLQAMGTCQSKSIKCEGTYQDNTCGGPPSRQCCLPDSTTQDKWALDDDKCTAKYGTCQPSHNECAGGTYEADLCGGPEARQCCVPGESTISDWENNEKPCTLTYGVCQHASGYCNGTTDTSLCKGTDERVCCSPSQKAKDDWATGDLSCSDANGKCQHMSSSCDGSYDSNNICGGPDSRKCCLSTPTNILQTSTSHTTNGLNRRSVMIIVAGLFVILVLIITGVIMSKKGGCTAYKRVKDDNWYERNGTEETVNLTACDENRANYA